MRSGNSAGTGKRRARATAGQVVAVPLRDGSVGLAQVAIGGTCITIVLFPQRAGNPDELRTVMDEALRSEPFAVMRVTGDELRDGEWSILGTREPLYPPNMLATGGRTSSAVVARSLFNGYFGLEPWDAMADPMDYEKRLLPGVPVPPTVRYKRDFEKAAAASASSAPSSHSREPSPDAPIMEGPAEIHVEIKYPGDALPSIDLLHRRQALEQLLEAAGTGEVTDAGGGGGVIDIHLRTADIRTALPLVEAAIRTAGFQEEATIQVSPVDDDDDDGA